MHEILNRHSFDYFKTYYLPSENAKIPKQYLSCWISLLIADQQEIISTLKPWLKSSWFQNEYIEVIPNNTIKWFHEMNYQEATSLFLDYFEPLISDTKKQWLSQNTPIHHQHLLQQSLEHLPIFQDTSSQTIDWAWISDIYQSMPSWMSCEQYNELNQYTHPNSGLHVAGRL